MNRPGKRESWAKASARRVLAGLILLLLGAVYVLPVAAVTSKTAKTCCSRKGPCCCKKPASDVPALKAVPDCQRQCQLPGALTQAPSPALPVSAFEPFASDEPRETSINTPVAASYSSYLAFLYQRPPPSH